MNKTRRTKVVQLCTAISISAALLLSACGGGGDDAQEPSTVATTQSGAVRGYADTGAWVFKGIPYAKPPVGELRWRAPQDPEPWTGVRDARQAAPVCTQVRRNAQYIPTGPVTSPDNFVGSEDCLYVDVYRPQTDTTGLPVFVWIHGGGWVLGGATSYNGAPLAKRMNAVVVVLQYRMGPMGNFSNTALANGEDALDGSGNFTLLDEIKALHWVQRNISAFGGDPTKVTIGGQSAGSVNVYDLMLSPLTTGLFTKAFSMSGQIVNVPRTDNLTNAMINWLLLDDRSVATDGTTTPPRYSVADWTAADAYRAAMSPAAVKAYLRSKSDYRIQLASAQANFRANNYAAGTESVPVLFPIMDGTVYPAVDGYDAIASGNYRHVPLLQGKTQNDSAPLTPVDRMSAAFMAQAPSNTIYNLLFTWKGGGDPAVADFATRMGAPHAADVPFWFGNQDPTRETTFSALSFTSANRPGRVLLSNAMMDYLGAFVRTGDPNPAGSGLPNWSKWSPGSPSYMVFDATTTDLSLRLNSGVITP